jgi:enoyl-CoA hydratase/carnithine racemase
MKADEAFQMGLVSQVVPHQALRQRTLELAEQISRNSLNAVVKAKELLNEFSESSGISVKSDAESHAFGRLFGTEDQKEGLSAFLEKRRPRFLNVSTKEV